MADITEAPSTADRSDNNALEVMSVRLFPKYCGLSAYNLTGVAKRCDWAIITDPHEDGAKLIKNSGLLNPRHIFLSMRQPFVAIKFLCTNVLPFVNEPIVVVSGSEDATFPMQIDKRWREFNSDEKRAIHTMLASPKIKRWYAENLSQKATDKLSPLPTGQILPNRKKCNEEVTPAPLLPRPRRSCVLCHHRVREGDQWATRRRVSALAESSWQDFTTTPLDELSHDDFVANVRACSFVICAEGGGLDPSPKVWDTLENGSIPILRKTTLSDAYALLPVVMVDDWHPDAITLKKLSAWKQQLSQWLRQPQKKELVRYRLSLNFWWKFIESGTPVRPSNQVEPMAVLQ